MHEVLVNRLGGLSLPRKSEVRLTDRPDMTLDVYRGRKTTKQQHCSPIIVQQILLIHHQKRTGNRCKTAEVCVFLFIRGFAGMHFPNSLACFKYFSVIFETTTD